MDLIKKAVIEVMKDGVAFTPLDQAFISELAETYFECQGNVLLGLMTPAEAAKAMQDAIDKGAR